MKETGYTTLKIVLDKPDATIVCNQHKPGVSPEYYQTEQELERELIKILESQGYEYRPEIKGEKDLKNNLRNQLEKLNSQRIPGFKFTDSEWRRFYFDEFEGAKNIGVANKTKKIQLGDCVFELKRDDGTSCNITIFNKKYPQSNYLQVINQFSDKERKSRYDVTILVNGLPLVQIELKRRGRGLEEAFHQINSYRDYSFSDLFEFVQLFIISNGTNTKYYSNTTKNNPQKNSFQFTSYWSYSTNNPPIRDLFHFAQTFLQKRTLLEILAKYCVLDAHGILKILRPYQIAAIERIICQIEKSINMKLKGTQAGGYIWHTTGSGKTLTSFKAAQLAMQIPQVKKVLFVVDRKDLDSQTYSEYKKFLGDVEDKTIDNTENTEKLKELINDNQPRIIITTIQKLGRLLNEKDSIPEEILNSKVVIVTDECHRSQTEEVHGKITKFKNRNLFGFTGTPLLKSEENETPKDKTKLIFGDCLHEYKIIDAIQDDNVLRFKIEYIGDISKAGIETDLNHPNRIKSIVKYIINTFDKKTLNRAFNSMLAVDSIPSAIEYYKEFKKQESSDDRKKLKIAMIFSDSSKITEGNPDKKLDNKNKTEELKNAIKDYNKMFGTSLHGFDEYREHVSKATKERKIDILLVVDMFLTGFDAPTLNTLWIDKNLKEHGLIQAFSRTNRILSKQKSHGNIACFRDLKQDIDDALTLFAIDAKNMKAIELPSYEIRIARYKELVKDLRKNFPIDQEIIGKDKEKEFTNKYSEFMELRSSLITSDEFESDNEMTAEEIQNYKSKYIDLMNKYRDISNSNREEEIQCDDMAFEQELLWVDEIDVDYIQNLLQKYHELSRNNEESPKEEEIKKMREEIIRVVNSSIVFSKEKKIVNNYLNFIDEGGNLKYQDYKKQEFYKTIDQLIQKEELKPEGTKKYINKFIEEKEIKFSGSQIQKEIMPEINNLIVNYQLYSDKWNKVKEEITNVFETFNILKYW